MKSKTDRFLKIPKTDHEDFLREKGFENVCGLDEVGRGAWAGPLVAGAVILNRRLYGLRDSKLLHSKKREKLSLKIWRTSLCGIGEVKVEELNKLKLTKGTQLAFRRAIRSLGVKPDYVLADGFRFHSPIPCRAIKKGDRICSSIAAASIIAKVYRDELMRNLDKEAKGYDFFRHKGYETKLHQAMIKKYGISPVHRKFFRGLKIAK